MKSLEQLSADLVHEYEYFTNLLALMHKGYSKNVSTARVGLKNNKIKLYVNPMFFATLNEDQQKKVLLHECLHVMHKHLLDKPDKLKNFAMDVAINQFCEISDFLPGALTINFPIFKDGVEVLPLQPWYYYHALLDEDKVNNCCIKTLDDHGEFGNEEENARELQRIMEKAFKNTSKKGKGILAGGLEDLIFIKKGRHDWRRELRTIVGNKSVTEERKTRLKQHKRIGKFSRGNRTLTGLHVAFIIDSSGSMSDDMLAAVIGEAHHLYVSKNCKVDLIIADTEVNSVISYTGNKAVKVGGRGGTHYQAAIDMSHTINADLVILAGDGDGCVDSLEQRNKKPFIWLLNAGCNADIPWGKKIVMED